MEKQQNLTDSMGFGSLIRTNQLLLALEKELMKVEAQIFFPDIPFMLTFLFFNLYFE